ncbi:MAG: helix-turn-helix domain-containing protein [Methylococcales bacterium]|nr:helix-turn-helix domain-containing protein [Methylococcales bacterium]
MDELFKDFQISCNNCNLDTICLPRGLSQQEIENLNSIIKKSSILQQGEYIYRQGDPFKGIIAIKSGTAKLVANDTEGNEHILNILLPGELVGFDGLNNKKYNCSAIALDVMTYCELPLPAEQFETLCQQVPSIARELFKHSSESICESQNQVVSNKRPAEEKVALFLINLSDRLNKRGFSSLSFNLPLSRQEMGNHLGLTLETTSRMLQHLQNGGLITVQRKKITINNLSSLRAVCSHDLK